jgi:superoxide dismutase, Cu-Zn family
MIKHTAIAMFFAAATWVAAAPVKVELKDAKGVVVGTARITAAERGGVLIHLKTKGLPVGEHAAHIHQNAKCEAGTPNFGSAGPHFNPEMKHHGLDNPDGPHAGDMANFKVVGKKGKADVTLVNTHVTMGTDDHSIFANGGTALVVHAKADDMKSDPAGNAGDRIACGTITK